MQEQVETVKALNDVFLKNLHCTSEHIELTYKGITLISEQALPSWKLFKGGDKSLTKEAFEDALCEIHAIAINCNNNARRNDGLITIQHIGITVVTNHDKVQNVIKRLEK